MGLPENKKNDLAKKVSDSVFREIKRSYKDMRDHEVSKEDAFDVIRKVKVTVNKPEELD